MSNLHEYIDPGRGNGFVDGFAALKRTMGQTQSLPLRYHDSCIGSAIAFPATAIRLMGRGLMDFVWLVFSDLSLMRLILLLVQ